MAYTDRNSHTYQLSGQYCILFWEKKQKLENNPKNAAPEIVGVRSVTYSGDGMKLVCVSHTQMAPAEKSCSGERTTPADVYIRKSYLWTQKTQTDIWCSLAQWLWEQTAINIHPWKPLHQYQLPCVSVRLSHLSEEVKLIDEHLVVGVDPGCTVCKLTGYRVHW